MDEKRKLIEAALFMTPQTVNVNQVMELISEPNYTMAKGIALSFMKEFNQRDSALQVVQIEDSFQMVIRPGYEEKVRHLAGKAIFHPGIMKTLALVAFKQPISQSLVVKYRNNKAYDHIHRLVEEGFVAREPKGRSFTLRTTKKFLEYFGEDAIKQKKLSGPVNPIQ
jgi:segregation and condensation protein B